jgi:hypothetical protein
MAVPAASFSYSKGETKSFSRSDLDAPVTRHFCAECGTHIGAEAPPMPGMIMLKAGTLDDPSIFTPQMAIYTCDMQSFHHVPEGIASFERTPG